MTIQLEKNKYLSKDEMIRFLKSKGIIIDPYTRNFPRFAKNNGIIFKKVKRAGSGGRPSALYTKPMQEKILEILERLKKNSTKLSLLRCLRQLDKSIGILILIRFTIRSITKVRFAYR